MFSDAIAAITWGAKNLSAVVPDHDLALRESRWMLEASAVAAGKTTLFLDSDPPTSRVAAVFRSHIARRARGEPLQYVIGESSFRGIDLFVTPDVLIPRPETEQFIDLIRPQLPSRPLRLIDQGTGSGAIAIALALERKDLAITAIDLSDSAAEIARRNVKRHGLSDRIQVITGDLYPPDGEFDVVVANLPYVPDDAVLPADVAEWEPRGALRGGKNGVEVIERSVKLAEKYGVALFFYEIGEEQAEYFNRTFSGAFEFHRDLTGRIRFMTHSRMEGNSRG